MPIPYGTILGSTHGNVLIYANQDDGYYQCVELARRYWLKNFQVEIPPIPTAYDLRLLTHIYDRMKNRSIPVTFHSNVLPTIGDLVIWKPVGVMKPYGHVAVIVSVHKDYVTIVEQNMKHWTRILSMDPKTYQLSCTYKTGKVAGILTLGTHRTNA